MDMSTTMEEAIKRFEADVHRLLRKPFAMLKCEAKAKHLALVECATRALVNGSDFSLPVISTGVVVLTGGGLDSG